MGCAYENASNTSGVISYELGSSIVITALGIPPSRCVGGIWGISPIWERSKPARGCW